MQACSAQIGSISLTITRAPAEFIASAQPLPTSPYPAMNATCAQPAALTTVRRRATERDPSIPRSQAGARRWARPPARRLSMAHRSGFFHYYRRGNGWLTFPAIITSVARMSPSGSEWRQPYRLSNLHLVTLSLTLMAGNSREPTWEGATCQVGATPCGSSKRPAPTRAQPLAACTRGGQPRAAASKPAFCISYRRFTPVVVSSETPTSLATMSW